MSGVCAAIAAARSGAQVVLLQDRSVLGGNASSEIRMWVCGAHGRFYKESGLLEEIKLLNQYRNPTLSYPVWDSVLYEKVMAEPNITLLLNAAVCEVEVEDQEIQSVRAWHLTRQCWIDVTATQFIDCSGDSILRLSGADHRWGRETQEAFGESLGQVEPDRKTMGNSILLQLRAIDPEQHIPFVAPAFAIKMDPSHPREARCQPKGQGENFWWIEVGGEGDTLDDADSIRDELMGIAYGVWDYIKNHEDGRGHGWELEWIGALPGKRENVRYVGEYTLRQQDIEAKGQFEDIVAYGGWTMDDHPPAAFHHEGRPTLHHPAPSPYGIPYRCLVSLNIKNLLFAGRNISATHMALSSTRVMGTCSLLGQAVGTAAAMAVKCSISPSEVGKLHMPELQNRLLESDQWLPGYTRALPAQTMSASLDGQNVRGELEALRDQHERRLKDDDHWVEIEPEGWVEYRWEQAVELEKLRLVVHTNLHDEKRMPCSYPRLGWAEKMPNKMPKRLTISIQQDGEWKTLTHIDENHRRLIILETQESAEAVRVQFHEAWGGELSSVFVFEVGQCDYSQEPGRIEWPEIVMTGKGAA